MSTSKTTNKIDIKVKISTLWIFVMFNMAFADILSFMLEYSTRRAPEVIATQEMMLIAAIIIEIPIAMIFLSRVLSYRANRLANIIAGILTIIFVIAGGSLDQHYIFIATVEVVFMAMIIWNAWNWSAPAKAIN